MPEPICPECGEPGVHWVKTADPTPLILRHSAGVEPDGLWLCAKFFTPDGRRLTKKTDEK